MTPPQPPTSPPSAEERTHRSLVLEYLRGIERRQSILRTAAGVALGVFAGLCLFGVLVLAVMQRMAETP